MSKDIFDSPKNKRRCSNYANARNLIKGNSSNIGKMVAQVDGASHQIARMAEKHLNQSLIRRRTTTTQNLSGSLEAIEKISNLNALIQNAIDEVSKLHILIQETIEEVVELRKTLKEQKQDK